MQIRLQVGARTVPTTTIPFAIEVVEFDDKSVVLALGDESEVLIEFDDWALGLASIGKYRGKEYVVQSGGQNYVDVPPVPQRRTRSRPTSPLPASPARQRATSSPVSGADVVQTFIFFRIALLQDTREFEGTFDSDEEALYDDRFGLRFRASSEDKILWDVTDPFAGLELSTVTTRDNDVENGTAEVVFHGNAKYYVVQGLGETEEGSYGLRVSEVMFGVEDLNRRCKACEEPEEKE